MSTVPVKIQKNIRFSHEPDMQKRVSKSKVQQGGGNERGFVMTRQTISLTLVSSPG